MRRLLVVLGTTCCALLAACSSTHHYVFQLLATDGPVTVKAQPTIVDLQQALQGHIVAQTQLRAMFGR